MVEDGLNLFRALALNVSTEIISNNEEEKGEEEEEEEGEEEEEEGGRNKYLFTGLYFLKY